MITHKLKYGIYHWDTFDNSTILIGQESDLSDALILIYGKYNTRISGTGADKVQIVDLDGNVVATFNIK